MDPSRPVPFPTDAMNPEEIDFYKLYEVLTELLNLPRLWGAFSNHVVWLALYEADVQQWQEHFLLMSKEDIQGLMVPPHINSDKVHVPEKKLGIPWVTNLVALLAFYNEESRKIGAPANIAKIGRTAFVNFRHTLDISKPITSWRNPTKETQASITNWRKLMSPSLTYFDELKTDYMWVIWKPKTIRLLRSYGLFYLCEPGTTKEIDPGLYTMQATWLTMAFDKKIQLASARTIFLKYRDDEDCAGFWKELTETMNKSMSIEIVITRITMHLTSARLANSGWRGSQAKWISDYNTQKVILDRLSGPE